MRILVLVAALAAAVPSAPAQAVAPSYLFALQDTYLPADVKVFQGQSLTFVNLDPQAHDVVSAEANEDFRSQQVGQGQSSVVRGVESLGLGYHQFYCQLHVGMRGTIEIVAPPA